MDDVRKKMRRQDGFTLIEMLIVVAIIAILIAISIPLVGSALERTRIATDAANERSAKAALTIKYLTETLEPDTGSTSHAATFVYNVVTGELVHIKGDSVWGEFDQLKYPAYGQCRGIFANTESHEGKYLWLRFDTQRYTVEMKWDSTRPGGTSGAWNEKLCSDYLMSGK